jgi:hypothetical protein
MWEKWTGTGASVENGARIGSEGEGAETRREFGKIRSFGKQVV